MNLTALRSYRLVQQSDSPYLLNDGRLGDVIAAIQTLGTYKFYKLDFAGWADRIGGDEEQADYWRKVFEEHSEFFRLDSKRQRASLVWRRQHQKLFDVDLSQTISREKYKSLTDEQKARISRLPLSSSEIATLVNTAINLHSRALENKKDQRWLVTALIGLAGVILGAWISS
jgi:hypothetical protein